MSDWKERLGVVYSTNTDYKYETESRVEPETLAIDKQNLRVYIERKGRGGKTATIVKGFVGTDGDLEAIGRELKQRLGVGGAVKDGEIIVQGELQTKVKELLIKMGYIRTR